MSAGQASRCARAGSEMPGGGHERRSEAGICCSTRITRPQRRWGDRRRPAVPVLAVDTVVYLDGRELGPLAIAPRRRSDVASARRLAAAPRTRGGTTRYAASGRTLLWVASAEVAFAVPGMNELAAPLRWSWRGKAGSYGLQDE